MKNFLAFAQIGVSLVVIVLILIQERSSAGGVGGIFGGGSGDGGFYQARRGMEKFIFGATIVLVIVFAALALLNLVL